jgi:hypothetical protein
MVKQVHVNTHIQFQTNNMRYFTCLFKQASR